MSLRGTGAADGSAGGAGGAGGVLSACLSLWFAGEEQDRAKKRAVRMTKRQNDFEVIMVLIQLRTAYRSV